MPYVLDRTYLKRFDDIAFTGATITRDSWSRFFENQMQINGGRNDGFVAWSDAGGLALSLQQYEGSRLWKLAEEFALADNFFQGTFGGSFINSQYLICACAPRYRATGSPSASVYPTTSLVEKDDNGRFTWRLMRPSFAAKSALDGPPQFLLSGSLAPPNYFGDGNYYAVNTMQPPFQPSGRVSLGGGRKQAVRQPGGFYGSSAALRHHLG